MKKHSILVFLVLVTFSTRAQEWRLFGHTMHGSVIYYQRVSPINELGIVTIWLRETADSAYGMTFHNYIIKL